MKPNKRTPKLFIGLGNPGREYAETRHNAGFLVLDRLARSLGLRFKKPFFAAWMEAKDRIELAEGEWVDLILVKPLTYMNASGAILSRLLKRHQLDLDSVHVVYDTLDLPAGRLRIRKKGSAGGQRGLASIIDALGDGNFPRIAVGIGRPEQKSEVVAHVLSVPTGEELRNFNTGLDQAAEALQELAQSPIDMVMNTYNVKQT